MNQRLIVSSALASALALGLVGQAAAPLALIVVGMGLAEYGVRAGWQTGAAMTTVKLVVQPLVIWGFARALGLPLLLPVLCLQSLKDAIRLFVPHMVKGASIVFDDYKCLAGADKAIAEWEQELGYKIADTRCWKGWWTKP